MTRPTDVLIIGAGAAGLSAAARLARAGRSVRVVEARPRIGGRVWTVLEPGQVPLEMGAEFVHGRNPHLRALLRAARLRVGRADGDHLLLRGRGLTRGDAGFGAAMGVLARAQVRGETAAAFLRRELKGEQRELALAIVRGFFAADPRRASAWALGEMNRHENGESVARVREGYGQALVYLRDQVLARGGELVLGAPVKKIHWKRSWVQVESAFDQWRAARLILTLPSAVLGARAGPGSLALVPELPEKRRAARALGAGAIVKVHARFREPLWKPERAGQPPTAFFHAPGQPVPVFWRPLPFETPMLVGWAAGPDGEALTGMPEDQLRRVTLRSLARIFRRKERDLERLLEDFRAVDWQSDPFARGGYAVIPWNFEDAPQVLAAPVEDTLFFAGEATHLQQAGTVHGALESGTRAAEEVLRTL